MIIDNKTYLDPSSSIRSVWDYLYSYTKYEGNMDIVTGYFTISALCLLKKFEKEPKRFRLILGEISGNDEQNERIIDLLSGDTSIGNGFQLKVSAKEAIEFLKQDNVEVKTITGTFCHAKTYIYKPLNNEDPYYITGSANLTEQGLGTNPGSNLELNIAERGKDRYNFEHLEKWFGKAWEKCAQDKVIVVENDQKVKKTAKQYFIDCIQNLYKDYEPRDIYYKILYELFRNDIEATIHDNANRQIVRLEETVIWNTLFDYQKKGARSLINMLTKYDGAILADAVGLGKTFSALAVIKYFQSEGYNTLILCPKKLEENWQQYRMKRGSRFEADKFDYEVRFHTDLQDQRLDRYGSFKLDFIKNHNRCPKLLVVIDESHNLRNDKSGRYKYLLEQILSEKSKAEIKVLELSATPINTNINDVRNQFKLFVRGKNNGFDTDEFAIPSLEALFKDAQKKLQAWNDEPERKISDLISSLPEKFLNLSDKLVVARTRKMIERSEGKSLGFPQKNPPINIYLGVENIGNLKTLDEIYNALLQPMLCAYMPNSYTKAFDPTKPLEDQRAREKFLVRMMLTLFLKRLESSWVACKITVEKVLAHHENALLKVTDFIQNQIDDEIQDDIPEDEEEELTLGKSNPVRLKDIVEINQFRKDLESDIFLLREFVANMQIFEAQFNAGKIKDEKLEKLKEILDGKVKGPGKKKVLIFTTYTDTAKYLYQQLSHEYGNRVAYVDGSGATFDNMHEPKFHDTLMRFAPQSKMYNEMDWNGMYKEYYGVDSSKYDPNKKKWNVSFAEWKKIIAESVEALAKKCHRLLNESVDILIATDCLSEGQNLQDAQTVINYDIHWNPVRLIQRVGRIDRIKSTNKAIDCVNFWPAQSYDEYLNLVERINTRMATMAIIGTETLEISQKLKEQLADNPIIDRNDKKLLEQLQTSIDEAQEQESTFGLQDLSFEDFRQDLMEFLRDKSKMLEEMPNGVYSGFKTVDSLFSEVPESIVALVGSPHRTVGITDHKYTEYWLILREANINEKCPTESRMETKVFNRQEILSILRHNQGKHRNVPAAIDRGDPAAIERLKAVMQGWIKEQLPQEQDTILGNLFDGDFSQAKKPKSKLEEKFQLDNLDLIAWEYITK